MASTALDQNSPADSIDTSSQGKVPASSVTTQESEEIPIRGFLTLKTFESKVVYCLTFSLEPLPRAPETARERSGTGNGSGTGDSRGKQHSPPRESVLGRTGDIRPFRQKTTRS